MKPKHKLCAAGTFVVLLLACSPCWSQQSQQSAEKDNSAGRPVRILFQTTIPTRDGIHLSATIYLPAETPQPIPAIFALTPYIADSLNDRGMYFARHGYAFAAVDVRGRGNSEGPYEPLVHDGKDGYDITEWLARQPWCNGKVAMWGGSYVGFDQWSTAKEFPPHLVTIIPAASVHPGIDFPLKDNIFYPYDLSWLVSTSGHAYNEKFASEDSFWRDRYIQFRRQHLAFGDLDKSVGIPSGIFETWVKHPTPDDYWSAMVPSPEQFAKLSIPILTITGDYDGDQHGALTYYLDDMRYGSASATQQHYLIIGPWDHGGTRTPSPEISGLHFAAASVLDMNKMNREWYDWTMKGASKPEFLKQRVAFYVAGLEQWKYADTLETVSNSTMNLYLHSDGHAIDAFRSGMLSDVAPAAEPTDSYTYDPLDTRQPEYMHDTIVNFMDEDERDQMQFTEESPALNLFGDGVIFHSAPFSQDTIVAGFLKFTAWISMDVPDTDFQVFVYQIQPDGRSIFLTSDRLRARYRHSLTQAELVKPGEITRYDFQTFQWFARQISKGSRLRLVLRCPNTLFLEQNYNGGGVVAQESGKDARTAHLTLYHDREHPSVLTLPVIH